MSDETQDCRFQNTEEDTNWIHSCSQASRMVESLSTAHLAGFLWKDGATPSKASELAFLACPPCTSHPHSFLKKTTMQWGQTEATRNDLKIKKTNLSPYFTVGRVPCRTGNCIVTPFFIRHLHSIYCISAHENRMTPNEMFSSFKL